MSTLPLLGWEKEGHTSTTWDMEGMKSEKIRDEDDNNIQASDKHK